MANFEKELKSLRENLNQKSALLAHNIQMVKTTGQAVKVIQELVAHTFQVAELEGKIAAHHTVLTAEEYAAIAKDAAYYERKFQQNGKTLWNDCVAEEVTAVTLISTLRCLLDASYPFSRAKLEHAKQGSEA